ncbi:MAG: RHS repeat protein [Burkholderiaceae bacterium]|nr:RHS repeat protein [Burkholderiaceae bacterium]
MNNTKTIQRAALAAAVLQALCIAPATAQNGPSTTFIYDARGQLSAVGLPGGRTRTLQWDALGRNTAQSGSGATVGMGYNGQDKLTAVVDPKGLATSYGRNGFGEAVSLTSPDTGASSHGFDANGNLSQRVNAAGQVESYTYDAADRVATKTMSHPIAGSLTYVFGYATTGPSAGRVVSVTAPGLTLGYSHNLLGQVTSSSQAVGGSPTLSVGYAYYSNGALASITYPSGRVVEFGYDGVSRISSITAGGSTLLSGVAYSPLGAVGGWTFGNGHTVTRGFDLNGRLASVTLPTGQRVYGFDDDDRITSITDAVLGNATYGYDDHDRLTSATTALGQWGYAYDPNGNRTQLTVDGATYGVIVDGVSNRELVSATPYLRQNQFSQDGQPTIVAGGSPQPACGNDVALGYTADGQLVTSNVLSASFGPDGLRLQKAAAPCAGGQTTNFVYDPAGRLLGEYDAAGVPIQETVWLGDTPVAVFKSNGQAVVAHYVYADNLNSPRAITNTSGQVVWRWDGEPFGATPADENPSGLGQFAYGLRFPGQYFDAETGYHQNRWREYDPKTGRYVQSDPIGLAGGLNTYSYVGSDPLKTVDPEGLWAFNLGGGIVGGISGGVGGYITGKSWSSVWKGALVGAGIGALNPLNSVLGSYAGGVAANAIGQALGNLDTNKPVADIDVELALLSGAGGTCGARLATYMANPRRSASAYILAQRLRPTPWLDKGGGAVVEGVVGGSTELVLNKAKEYQPIQQPKSTR